MTHLKKTLPFLLMLAFSAPVLAQTTEDTAPAEDGTTETSPNPLELSMGEEVDPNAEAANGEPKVGDVYVAETHGDWELRCIKAEEGTKDPCQLYQLLKDDKDNAVAEINIFPLGGEGNPAAGATVITPLETLLTQQLGMSVDGSAVRKYPYSWCSQIGCFSRIGFTDADVSAFKRGINAALVIVPVAAPDQKVTLSVSLKGFTAGFEAAKGRAAAE